MKYFNFPEVRVVEASAGSGKTYALAKRYVQLLLNSELPPDQVPLRNILAITFTNKAAFEMKARILEFLKKTALNQLDPHEVKNILEPLGIDRQQARKKAFLIMEQLIRHYNFFQVQTIDSFINALLSGCAFKIGLSANFRIRKDYPAYLQYSLDETIEQTLHDPKVLKLFRTFLRQYLFLENKNGWFPKKDMLDLLQALYEQRNIYGMDFMGNDIRPEDLMAQKRKIFKLLERLSEELPPGVHQGFLKSFEGFMAKSSSLFDIDKLPEYFSRQELPVKKDAEVPAKTERLWKQVRQDIRDLCEEEAASLFNPYIAVFKKAMETFERRSVKDDVLFLGELNKKARSLFDEWAITVEELYYRLATRFGHYLFDEFQDTSRLQWRNLRLMVEEALSTGGSLFYVGDKKQAIFDFRGGDVRLFDSLTEEFRAFNVERETLAQNFRSEKAIVDFNNKVFSAENLSRFLDSVASAWDEKIQLTGQDKEEILGVFGTARQIHKPGHEQGSVRVQICEGKTKDQRQEATRPMLLNLIKELRERYSFRDMALLTRSNDEIERLTSWLMAENIFVESERTLNIKESPVIFELVAFLQFLNSPVDNLAFSRVIAGEIFTRAAKISKQDMHGFLFGLRKRVSEESGFYLYKEFRERYSEIWDRLIDEFFRNVGLYPLYEFTVSLMERLQVLENFPDQQGFIMHFLELIKKQEEEHADIGSFLEAFDQMEHEELFVKVSDSDAIKIMTIHKAKGLEFPVVIIPFLDMRIRAGTSGGLGQQSYVLGFQEKGLELLRIKSKYLKFSDKLSQIQRREYQRSLMTELNNIYVALTRASKEIYAFIPKKSGSETLMEMLIPEEIRNMGQPMAGKISGLKAQSPLSQGTTTLKLSRYRDWIEFLKDEFGEPEHIRLRERILEGEVMHHLLSFVGNIHGQTTDLVITRAVESGQSRFPEIPDFSSYRHRLEKLLSHESLKRFFDVPGGQVFEEQEVVDKHGRTRRLDRLIVFEREAWVIDYKSSHEAPELSREQVKEYLGLMSEIYPKKKIRGFIVYLDDLKAQEID